MPLEGLMDWRAEAESHYRNERIAAGDSAQYAEKRVQESRQYFPQGRPAPGQLVFEVLHGDQVVGSLWIGVLEPDQPSRWWVMDIQIAESHRRRGIGRTTMRLAEREVRRRGGDSLGLNVFGPNVIARRLYDALGYEVLATNMVKVLR
jgi:ribosomal protein S18 acetylase RimI-like enzyme